MKLVKILKWDAESKWLFMGYKESEYEVTLGHIKNIFQRCGHISGFNHYFSRGCFKEWKPNK